MYRVGIGRCGLALRQYPHCDRYWTYADNSLIVDERTGSGTRGDAVQPAHHVRRPTYLKRVLMAHTEAQEWLVLLDQHASQAAVAGLREIAEVLYVIPPRLVVVSASDDAALQAVPGVLHVLDSVPESLLRSLQPDEAIAARAFMQRKADRGPRPGEGLPWDAPGRKPPDYPPHR